MAIGNPLGQATLTQRPAAYSGPVRYRDGNIYNYANQNEIWGTYTTDMWGNPQPYANAPITANPNTSTNVPVWRDGHIYDAAGNNRVGTYTPMWYETPQRPGGGTPPGGGGGTAPGGPGAQPPVQEPGGGGPAPIPGSGTDYSEYYLESGGDMFAQNPEAMLFDMLMQQYGDNNRMNALYSQLEPRADAANVLYFALTGQNADEGTTEDFVNWLGNFWSDQMTPGQYTDTGSALGNIFNPQQNSPLASYLALGDAQEQSQALMGLMAGVADLGFHPLFGNAMMNRMGDAQTRYLGEAARGQVDPFFEYVQQTMPYLHRLIGTNV